MKLIELKQERAEAIKKMRGMLDKAEVEKKDLTDEETRDYETLEKSLDDFNTKIAREEKLENLEEENKQVTRKMYHPAASAATRGIETASVNGASKSKTFRGMFYGDEQFSLDKGEFRDFNEFVEVLASGKYEPRLERRTFVEKDGPKGGYQVPEELAAMLVDKSLEDEIVRPRAMVYPMIAETKKIPAWDNSNHSTNVYGGFTGVWMGENQTQDVQTGKMRLKTLTAGKLGIYTEASREVLADGMDFGSQIAAVLPKAIGFYLDSAFLSGDGVGKPLGVINSQSRVKVVRSSTGILYADVVDMFGRLHPTCQKTAVWLANYECIPRLMKMKDDSSALVWSPVHAYGIAGPVPISLFGKDIIFTEKLPGIGQTGDMVLCDLSQYAIGLRQELVLERSNAPGWLRDVESFRAIMRVDGGELWKDAVTPANGTETLSWAVCLSTST